MTARDYIHELLEFDRQRPELGVLDLPIVVHSEDGRLVEAASFYIGEEEGRPACMHLDAPAPAASEQAGPGQESE